MKSNRVTVICLCYNQARFVRAALDSVVNQLYPNIQLIVIDDCSRDGSVEVIQDFLKSHPDVLFIPLQENLGNCKAFNKALPHIDGDFVIDLSGDDMLLPERIGEGVNDFNKVGADYGIHFSDGEYMDEKETHLSFHSQRFPHDQVPQGDVYVDVIRRFFICSPTVMIRTEVLKKLNGYDENLAYEDFDLWVRTSRNYKFIYSPKILVRKRVHPTSWGQQQFIRGSAQLNSTFKVCEKIAKLNQSPKERRALTSRIFYEMRVCVKLIEVGLFFKYARLLLKNCVASGTVDN